MMMINILKKKLSWIARFYRDISAYPKLSLEHVDYDKYWQDKRGKNMGTCNSYQLARAEWILKRIKEGVTVTDLGCGDGSVLLHMLRNKSFIGIGVDTSEYALDYLSSQGVETIHKKLDEDSALDSLEKSDHILMLEVLEHMQNPEEFLQNAINKARKSVFFSFPNTGFIKYRFRFLCGRFPVQWRIHPGEHLRYWTLKDLQWWLSELGYAQNATIHVYEGVPILNKIFKSLLGAAFIVELKV